METDVMFVVDRKPVIVVLIVTVVVEAAEWILENDCVCVMVFVLKVGQVLVPTTVVTVVVLVIVDADILEDRRLLVLVLVSVLVVEDGEGRVEVVAWYIHEHALEIFEGKLEHLETRDGRLVDAVLIVFVYVLQKSDTRAVDCWNCWRQWSWLQVYWALVVNVALQMLMSVIARKERNANVNIVARKKEKNFDERQTCDGHLHYMWPCVRKKAL
jgi:hypothetical protein